MDKRDYFEVLGLSKGATEADIKKAYRRLAKQFHPDQNKGDKKAEERFKEIQEAYSVLSDKDKRARYEQFGHAGLDPRYATATEEGSPGGNVRWTVREGEPADFDFAEIFGFGGPGGGGASSVFENIFRGHGRRGSRVQEPVSGGDVEHEVNLTFEQAIHGTTLDLLITGPSKRETIAVRIPPGVHDGQRIRVRGKGQPGAAGGAHGDLHVICRVQPHAYFRREGNDIYLIVPITFSEAGLGAKVDLPTLDGTRTVTVPPGTPSGAKLRLAGLGVKNPRDGSRGDHYAVIKIVPPKNPSDAERQALSTLAEAETRSPREGLWP